VAPELWSTPTANMNVVIVDLAPNTRTRTLCHPYSMTVFFVLKGRGSINRDAEVSDLSVGDVVIVRPNSPHYLAAPATRLLTLMTVDPAVDTSGFREHLAKPLPALADTMLVSLQQTTREASVRVTEQVDQYRDVISQYLSAR